MEPVTLALLAAGGGALLGGGAGVLGGMAANKNRAKPKTLPKYTGPTPPSVSSQYFRPIEQMISETLMRRSQGQDVGFDPKRREQLQGIYDIDYNRAKKDMTSDALNRLSGSGQSRNLAAQEALIGDREKYMADTRSKYLQGLDVEDLTRRSEERENATRMLQDQNKFNFGQEDRVADFGLQQYGAENDAMVANYNMEDNYAKQYQNPWASALSGAASGAGTAMNMTGGIPKAGTTGTYAPTFGVSGQQGNGPYYQALIQKRNPLANYMA